jgi:hypothetical protein
VVAARVNNHGFDADLPNVMVEQDDDSHLLFDNKVAAIVKHVGFTTASALSARDLRVALGGLELRKAPQGDSSPAARSAVIGRVTEATTEVLVTIDCIGAIARPDLLASLHLVGDLLNKYCGAIARIGVLDRSTPAFDVSIEPVASATDPAKDWNLRLLPSTAEDRP